MSWRRIGDRDAEKRAVVSHVTPILQSKSASLCGSCFDLRSGKLHIGLDRETGDIVASKLTTEHVGDETALPELHTDIDADVSRFLADGAYDGQGVVDCLESRFGSGIEITIPPPKNAVRGENAQRNRHVAAIAKHGRMNWQAETGYNQRSQVEAQISRWKQAIGERLQARDFDRQIAEAKVAAKALNRMTGLGRAMYERVI